ncbi:hypothetical protein, partial [Lentilactobacillus kisonensis]|uniref:hypothetical protein n=1 Tax=Lentilactobacillus kisonensis TaxID=481722 RepID=UPI001C65EDC4
AVRVRNQAFRDWSLSFLRQKSWAWIFGEENLGASLCLVEHVSTMLLRAFLTKATNERSAAWKTHLHRIASHCQKR